MKTNTAPIGAAYALGDRTFGPGTPRDVPGTAGASTAAPQAEHEGFAAWARGVGAMSNTSVTITPIVVQCDRLMTRSGPTGSARSDVDSKVS